MCLTGSIQSRLFGTPARRNEVGAQNLLLEWMAFLRHRDETRCRRKALRLE